jgi:hypothetical protein
MTKKNLNLDEMCNRITAEITNYDIEKVCAQMVKNFIDKNNSRRKILFCTYTLISTDISYYHILGG